LAARYIHPSLLERLLTAALIDPARLETGGLAPMLGLLNASDPQRLALVVTELRVQVGQIIFEEGEAGDSLFVIWHGRVAIIKGELSSESPALLAILKPGHIFGEMALLENQPRSASVVAMDAVRLLEVNRASFEQLLREHPDIGREIMAILSRNVRRMSEASSSGEREQRVLSRQVSALETEKQRLEDLQRLRQETTELIIHDLRNPLSAIAMALRMLGMLPPADGPQRGEILAIAQANVSRMQSLVDSLLEVSRIEAGDSQLVREAVDVIAMIETVVCRQAVLALDEVEIITNLPFDLPPVYLDRDKIERVLGNLLDNALKYSPRLGKIWLDAHLVGQELQISVTDQGPGIPPEDRERIFQRFSQVTENRATRRGFGLGLTYCRLAVALHNGRIWMEAGPQDTGSRFIFTLPLV
jgi:signal transduction histidine kinase